MIKKSTANDALVTNCAMLLVNVDATGMFNTANQFCVSCMPTYQPNITTGVIDACNKIVAVAGTNCPDVVANTKYSLNTCNKCVWTINASKNIVKSTDNTEVPDCLDTVTALPNCFAGLNDGSKNVCKVCNPGYEVDTNGQCY